MTLYKVRKVFKQKNKRARIVARGLSKKAAQVIVQEDLKVNPDAKEYMLTYTEDW